MVRKSHRYSDEYLQTELERERKKLKETFAYFRSISVSNGPKNVIYVSGFPARLNFTQNSIREHC